MKRKKTQETNKNSSFMIVGAETSLECEDSDSDSESELVAPCQTLRFSPKQRKDILQAAVNEDQSDVGEEDSGKVREGCLL